MPDSGTIITAQVVLLSPQGRSIAEEYPPATTATIEHLKPSGNAVTEATSVLQQIGFTCTPSYPTLSISGPISLFEKTFKITFQSKQQGSLAYYVPGQKATIPPPLKNIVSAIVFGEPVELF